MAKKFLYGFLLLVLVAAYLGSVAISVIVVWPVAWYLAVWQIIVTALSGPVAWELGVYLFNEIFHPDK